MTLTVHHICSGPQTGKTTMALGFLEKLHARGHDVLYVAPTFEMARHRQRYTPVPCVGPDFIHTGKIRALAVDDCDHLPAHATKRIVDEWERMAALQGPTQLLLVNWRGEFPPPQPSGQAPTPAGYLHEDGQRFMPPEVFLAWSEAYRTRQPENVAAYQPVYR